MRDNFPSFFMAYTRVRPDTLVPYIESNNIPLLTNAMGRWSTNTDRWLDMWEYDTPHVIDAGGYNVMARFATDSGNLRRDVSEQDVQDEFDQQSPFYPWDIESYHEWLDEHSHEFEWATVMDYACEDRFNKLWSVAARREKTWHNTVEHFNTLDDSNADYTLLPVLQGRCADDYVAFYERLEDHGLPTDYVGLGTVCRISNENEIVELEQEIRERTGVEYVHGFGVKISAFRKGATFDTADSQAWAFYPSRGQAVVADGGALETVDMRKTHLSLERTTISFKEYHSHAQKLLEQAHGGEHA